MIGATGKQRWTAPRRARVVAASVVAGLSIWLGAHSALRLVPLPEALFEPPHRNVELLDRHGRPLLTRPPGPRGYSLPVHEAALPSTLTEATLAAEDKRFFHHSGVDWIASLRGATSILRHGRFTSGGSTITQQLIKLTHPRPRTIRTKLIEALQALRLEQMWDKERILGEYLNRLDYGNRQIGAEQAARFYFNKPARLLDTAEAALLAGLPQRPSWLDPLRHPDRAHHRRQWILHRLHINGNMTADELAREQAKPMSLAVSPRAFHAPHFTALVLPLARHSPSPLRTTLDLDLQQESRRILGNQLHSLRGSNVRSGAVVVIENASGSVRAMVGSPDYFSEDGGRINGAWIPRSPGSALKPFLFELALEKGWSPDSLLLDVPTEFPTATGLYRPVNYDRRHQGLVSFRSALANSRNVPAVRLLEQLGGPAVLQERLLELGFSTLEQAPDHHGLGLALGNAEVRLLELANAYACLARLGIHRPLRLLETDASPQSERSTQICSPGPARHIAEILSDNQARAYAFGLESPLRMPFPVACKTGTSSDYRDNWAFGYTPEFTVGVWVGNPDASPMRQVSGLSGAGPVLRDVFTHLHARFRIGWYAPAADLDSTDRPPPATRPAPDAWQILSPINGTVFYLDPDLPHEGGIVPLRTSIHTPVRWHSETLRCAEEEGGSVALLTPGEHRLTATDIRTGEFRSTTVSVKRL